MESFTLDWPKEENWRIIHSRVEGDGRTIVFELKPERAFVEGERVLQFLRLTGEKPDAKAFFQSWWQEYQKLQKEVSIKSLDMGLAPDFEAFEIKGIRREERFEAAHALLAPGNQSLLFHLHFFPAHTPKVNMLQRDRLLFSSLRFVGQSLKQSLASVGMLPEEKEGGSDALPATVETLPDFMIPFAHPLHPLDFFYYDVSKESGKAEVAWARFLQKKENNLFIGLNITQLLQ